MDQATERNVFGITAADLAEAKERLGKVGVIKSATTGRIRLQLRSEYRTSEMLAMIRRNLEEDARVKKFTINERTGSVVITFDSKHNGHSILKEALAEAEMFVDGAFDLPEDEEEEGGAGGGSTYGKLDQQAANLMIRLDQAIYRRSGGKIHTRGRVFPLSIAGLGVAQMVVYGISLEMLPGPLLIWIAHDIHKRFSEEHTEAEQEALASGKAAEETTVSSPVAGGMTAAAA